MPARAWGANWYGRVALSNMSAHCFASVRATSRRKASPVAIPGMPPSGLSCEPWRAPAVSLAGRGRAPAGWLHQRATQSPRHPGGGSSRARPACLTAPLLLLSSPRFTPAARKPLLAPASCISSRIIPAMKFQLSHTCPIDQHSVGNRSVLDAAAIGTPRSTGAADQAAGCRRLAGGSTATPAERTERSGGRQGWQRAASKVKRSRGTPFTEFDSTSRGMLLSEAGDAASCVPL